MSFIDELDLSVAEPVPAPSFSMGANKGAVYDKDKKTWWINEIGGYIAFKLKLQTLHGINLILKLQSIAVSEKSDCPITISVNGANIVENFDPNIYTFYNQSFYLPLSYLQVGDNEIKVQLPDGTTGVYLQAATATEFTMEMQQQPSWCWATVTSCVSGFYDKNSTWTPCKVVNTALEQSTCCQDGATKECDIPWYLDRSLKITGNFVSFAKGDETIDTVLEQLNGNKPLGIRMAFGQAGHFIMITGVGANKEMVAVEDSYFGPSYIKYDTLKKKYKGAGEWSYSYFTKPNTGG
ncbi:MAG: hypothetical protein GY765_43105 [bacterium]|nr:hypothetical protein [bacterium]